MRNQTSIVRLLRYKNALLRLKGMNFVRVYSENLADATGGSANQVRKDFSAFGVTGNRRGGYKVDRVIEQLDKILGTDKVHDFILIGAGNLGRALLCYQGFRDFGIRIVAAFDIDAIQFNKQAHIPVFPLDHLTSYIRDNRIVFAIVAVPDFSAQMVLELMLPFGIKGVLNFAPICLKGPQDCIISNISLVNEMENIIYFVNASREAGETEICLPRL